MTKFLIWLKSLFIHSKEEKSLMSKIVLALSALAGVLANGAAANTLTVTVTDDAGAPLAGQAVTLSGDVSVAFSANSLTTDANGSATVDLTSTQAGTYQVTATLADGTTQSISVVFLAVPVAQSPAATAINNFLSVNGVNDFEAAFEFVLDGVEKLGETAKADLISLAKKYL